jgi:hypothetical protein
VQEAARIVDLACLDVGPGQVADESRDPGILLRGLRDELGDVTEGPPARAYAEDLCVEVELGVRFPGVRADVEGFRREPLRPLDVAGEEGPGPELVGHRPPQDWLVNFVRQQPMPFQAAVHLIDVARPGGHRRAPAQRPERLDRVAESFGPGQRVRRPGQRLLQSRRHAKREGD